MACGAEMKNSFCLVRNREAYISQHIGELTSRECLGFYRESIEHLQAVLEFNPQRAACDLHPDYLSTRYAYSLHVPCMEIQHHHAHAGAVLAEQGIAEPALSIILDGTGYGSDGTVFGGEIYRVDRRDFVRLGRLAHLLLPGGDRAAHEPWRMALALLYRAMGPDVLAEANQPSSLRSVAREKKTLLVQIMDKGLNCPRTSSCGRLFDAVSALLGLCLHSSYEGQAAMLLEHQANLATKTYEGRGYPIRIDWEDDLWMIDTARLGPAIIRDLADGVPIPVIALRFHVWLAASLTSLLTTLRQQTRLSTVVLAGGCMQNKVLFELLVHQLNQHHFQVHGGEQVPMNDGGIALGQAYIGGTPPCV